MTRFHRIRRLAPAVLVALIVLASTSCSSKPGAVKGKISVNGKPLASGLISFLPQSGDNNPINVAITDGMYDSTPIIPPGLAKIYIIQSPSKPEEGKGGGNDFVPAPKKANAANPNSVPVRFQDASTSGLTVEVKSGETIVFDKDLTP